MKANYNDNYNNGNDDSYFESLCGAWPPDG